MSVDTEARPSDIEARPSTRRTVWQLGAILSGAFVLQIAGAALAVAAWAAAAWLLARERQRTAPAGRALAPVTAV